MNELAGKNYSPVGSGKTCLPYGLPAGWADHPILLGGSREFGQLGKPIARNFNGCAGRGTGFTQPDEKVGIEDQ